MTLFTRKLQKGFTFIELVVVIGIIALLFAIGVVSSINVRSFTVSNTSLNVFISDLKGQQIKAMVGDTEGRGEPDAYGIKLLDDSYILFHGLTYSATNTSNFSVSAPTGYSLSSTFSNDSIIFASGSGEIVDFSSNQNTITLTSDDTGQSKVLHLNQYGSITSIE